METDPRSTCDSQDPETGSGRESHGDPWGTVGNQDPERDGEAESEPCRPPRNCEAARCRLEVGTTKNRRNISSPGATWGCPHVPPAYCIVDLMLVALSYRK